MRVIHKIYLFFLVLPVFFSGSLMAQSIQVAVLKFQNASEKLKETNFLSEQFAAIIESRLRRENKIQLQERRNLKDVLQEIELNQYGIFDESKEVEIGRLLRSDFLISGQYQTTSEITKLIFRVIHVDTGEVGFIGDIAGSGIEFLKRLEATAGMAAADILGERSATLTVNTVPSESKIYVDGNYIGESPIVGYPLTSGSHAIRTEKEFYVPSQKNINMKEGEPAEENMGLHFKPYEFYEYRTYFFFRGFSGSSLPFSESVLPTTGGLWGWELGLQYFFGKIVYGPFISYSETSRENKITVFNNEYIENRNYFNFLMGFKFEYHYIINPKYLAITPGVSISYRYLRDKLNDTNAPRPENEPYEIQSNMIQPALHLNFEIMPSWRTGFHVGIRYLPMGPVKSYNGKFSAFGIKTFEEVKVDASQISFHLGASVFFNKRIID